MDDILNGKYQLIEQLGEGGMGTVYRAHQLDLEREVAVKVISPQFLKDSQFSERFRREAQTAARLDHVNIIEVYDFGQNFMVMQMLKGGSLKERIMEGQQFSVAEIAAILLPLADALDYAHSQGVIHRDIKPDNIMFDSRGVVKLVDFGVAHLQHATYQMTHTGTRIGTQTYMAPEQWRGRQLTGASDQYALAIVVYIMLVGIPPFMAETSEAMMYMHLSEDPPPVTKASKTVNQVLKKALAKEPENRFPSVTAFAQAFMMAVTGSKTPSVPFTVPAGGRSSRTSWIMGGVALIITLILGVLLLSSGGKNDSNEVALRQTDVSLRITEGALTDRAAVAAFITPIPASTDTPEPSDSPTWTVTQSITLVTPTATLVSPTATLWGGYQHISDETGDSLGFGFAVPGSCVQFRFNGRFLETSTWLYDIKEQEPLVTFPISFSQDERYVLGEDGVYDLLLGQQILTINNSVYGNTISPDGRYIGIQLSGLYEINGASKVFDFAQDQLATIRFSPDSRYVSVAGDGLYDIQSGIRVVQYSLGGIFIQFTSDGQFVAVDYEGIYEISTGRKVIDFYYEDYPYGGDIDFSDSERYVVVGSVIYDFISHQPVYFAEDRLISYQGNDPVDRFSPGEEYFYTNQAIVNLRSGEEIIRFPYDDFVHVTFDPLGRFVHIADVGLYELSTRELVIPDGFLVEFTPDGRYMISSFDGIYDLENFEKIYDLVGHVTVSPSRRYVFDPGVFEPGEEAKLYDLLELESMILPATAQSVLFTPNEWRIEVSQDYVTIFTDVNRQIAEIPNFSGDAFLRDIIFNVDEDWFLFAIENDEQRYCAVFGDLNNPWQLTTIVKLNNTNVWRSPDTDTMILDVVGEGFLVAIGQSDDGLWYKVYGEYFVPNEAGSSAGRIRTIDGWVLASDVEVISFRADIARQITPPPDPPFATPTQDTTITTNNEWQPIDTIFTDDPAEARMVYVPPGSFVMGYDDDPAEPDQMPEHSQTVIQGYWIDETEVTRAQYHLCMDAGFCTGLVGIADYNSMTSVSYVTWDRANEYCSWRNMRLPTELEWEYAARGPSSWLYPWGNDWEPGYAIWAGTSSQGPSTSVPGSNSASWVGALDMSGNLWEWTSSLYVPYPYDPSHEYDGSRQRVIRGGAFNSGFTGVRTVSRAGYDPGTYANYFGFRCVRDQ